MLPDHLCRGLVEHLVVKKRSFVEYFAVLTPSRFLFFHNNEQWVEGKKAQMSIYVPAIISLEIISDSYLPARRACVFQVIVSGKSTEDRIQHVFTASSSSDLNLWIDCLEKARLTNEVWLLSFHPGIFEGRWSCCQKPDSTEEGCEATRSGDYPNEEDPRFRRRCHVATYRGYQGHLTHSVRVAEEHLKKGESVIVVDIEAKENTVTIVSNSKHHVRGPVGRENLRMGDIREESWFFQELPPTIATALLQCMASGTFLVRSFRRRLALSLVVEDTVRHHWIHQDDKALCYVETEFRFSNIQEMVLFYSKQGRLGHRLNQFPKRENLEKLWHLDKKQLELKTEMYSQHLPYAIYSGSYGPVPVIGMSSRPKQIRSEVDVLRKAARMLMCLDHPNLVKLIGVYHEDVEFTLVLEDVPPLLSFIASYGLQRLLHEWEVLVSITHNLATALLFLHRKGIVHNEVVVENCFLHAETLTAKLGNFQYARFEDCRPDSVQEELLHRHSRLLLPPPEVTRQSQAASCQTDIWAFGILLWMLFHSGGQPTPISSVHQILSTRWSHLMPELANIIGQLIYSCVHEVPQLRISAYELAKQLRNILELKKQLRHSQQRPQSQTDLVFDQRSPTSPHIHTSLSVHEMTALQSLPSPTATVKTKKKRRFLRSYGRKHQTNSASSTGGDSPASTTASSLENVQFQPQQRSRSASGSPASGLLRGLRGMFGSGTVRGVQEGSPATIPRPGYTSDSAMSSLPNPSPMLKATSFSGVNIRHDGRGSDSNDTLSWDGWAPDSMLVPADGNHDLQPQYDQLREYCRSLLVKLKRERRERIRLASELSKTKEDLECKIMESETERRQLAKEMSVQQKASEERIRQLQVTIGELEREVVRRGGPGSSDEATRDQEDLAEALKKAELRLSAYEALTAKLQSQLFTGAVTQPPNGLSEDSAISRDSLVASPPTLNNNKAVASPSLSNHRNSQQINVRVNGFDSPLIPKRSSRPSSLPPHERDSALIMRPPKPPPAPPHRSDSMNKRTYPQRPPPVSHTRTPSSDTSASSGQKPNAFSRTRPSDSSSSAGPMRSLTSTATSSNCSSNPTNGADTMNTLV